MEKNEFKVKRVNEFEYEYKESNPCDLEPHKFLYDTFLSFGDIFYTKENKNFGYYDIPLIYKNKVLSQWAEVQTAKDNKLSEMLVCEISGIEENGLIRLVAHRARNVEKNWGVKYRLLLGIANYLKNNPKGREWSKELGGKMRDKLQKITGIGKTYIGYILYIYHSQNYEIRKRFEDGDLSPLRAYDACIKNDKPLFLADGKDGGDFIYNLFMHDEDDPLPSAEQHNHLILKYNQLLEKHEELLKGRSPSGTAKFKCATVEIESDKNKGVMCKKINCVQFQFDDGEVINYDLESEKPLDNSQATKEEQLNATLLKQEIHYELCDAQIKLTIAKNLIK